ncbi:MAG: recombinase family protein, partial [Spirochaetes bacterium]|nr:recombinase family protein [Spirochaetota bacterium]
FIEDTIPLPSLLRLRSSSYLEALYSKQHLSAREIARLAEVSRSMVLEALDRFGIPQNGNRHKRVGPLPFGFDYLGHQLVKNGTEQAAIRMMRQYRAGGLSLREIAGNLNQKLIPTKQNGIWQANTVREILARA